MVALIMITGILVVIILAFIITIIQLDFKMVIQQIIWNNKHYNLILIGRGGRGILGPGPGIRGNYHHDNQISHDQPGVATHTNGAGSLKRS
uniref:Col_cuticle_N domain-containing protein n=1 Tax=Meloidogyne hapla TaxID=6305 RepID=A0A1I8BGR9_MELHA